MHDVHTLLGKNLLQPKPKKEYLVHSRKKPLTDKRTINIRAAKSDHKHRAQNSIDNELIKYEWEIIKQKLHRIKTARLLNGIPKDWGIIKQIPIPVEKTLQNTDDYGRITLCRYIFYFQN